MQLLPECPQASQTCLPAPRSDVSALRYIASDLTVTWKYSACKNALCPQVCFV